MRKKEDYYTILAESPKLEKAIGIIWLIWLICTTLVFTKITTGEFLNFRYRIIMFIAVGMYPSIDIFSNIDYVRKINKNIKVFITILYVPNIVLLIIKEVADFISEILAGNNIDCNFIIAQCIFISFWLLSIPIPLIKSKVNCILNMILVLGFTVSCWVLYNESEWIIYILDQYLIIISLIVVVFSFILSIVVSKYRIEKILDCD